jgi:hypothetical protein
MENIIIEKTKTCKTCNVEKSVSCFPYNRRICKPCMNIHQKDYMVKYYHDHKDSIKEHSLKVYYIKHGIDLKDIENREKNKAGRKPKYITKNLELILNEK